MSYCRACRRIMSEDIDNPDLVFGICQECGRNNRVILSEYYNNIPQKE